MLQLLCKGYSFSIPTTFYIADPYDLVHMNKLRQHLFVFLSPLPAVLLDEWVFCQCFVEMFL